MAVYTDDFNRADGTLTAPWSNIDGDVRVSSNRVTRSSQASALPAMTRYTTALSSTDQYAEIDYVSGSPTIAFVSPALCVSNSGKNAYFALVRESGNLAYIGQVISGVVTWLATSTLGTAPPFRVRLERAGDTLRLYKDGVLLLSHPLTGTPLSSPYVGIALHNDAAAVGDNWEGGDLAIPTPTLGTITTTAVTSNSISFSIPVTY